MKATYDEIHSLLKRRPLTIEDVNNLFDEKSINILEELVKNREISLIDSSGVEFYKIS